MNVYFIVALVLAAYLGLAWLVGVLLRLHGSSFWLLWGCLALIGVAGAIIFLWFHRKLQREQAGVDDPAVAAPEEIKALLRRAEQKLRTAKHPGSLRSLPVVFVLGEEGSAKTSTIVHSGLYPELLSGQVFQDGDVVPTSAINVWYARDTVFVEAGGKIASDPRLWRQLLHATRPGSLSAALGRGQQAPRAALVCFECERLPSSQSSARTLASRLKEMAESLRAPLPVYVVFTKLDRIKNFADFVGYFTAKESAQPVGATFPRTATEGVFAEQESARLSKAFDQIVYSLAEKRLDYLRRDAAGQKVPGIYEFPRELAKLRNLAVQFLVEIVRPAHLSATPFLRGYYLSGVRAIIRNEAVSLAAGAETHPASPSRATRIFSAGEVIAAAAPAPSRAVQSQKVPEWCFLPYLFSEVILPDREAFSSSRRSTRVSLLRRWMLAGAAVIFLFYAVALLVSFFNNRDLELATRRDAASLAAGSSEMPEVADRSQLQQLEELRRLLTRLNSYETDGPPLSYRFGLYSGQRVYAEASRIYFAHFRRLLLAPTQQVILARLRTLPTSPSPSDDYGDPYDSLKAYLMTTIRADKTAPSFLAPVLLDRWSRGRGVDPERMALARLQFEYYAARLQRGNMYPADADAPAIAKARDYLNGFQQNDRVYQRLLADAGKNGADIDFNHMFPGSAAVVIDAHVVPAAFTKEGFKYVQDAVRNPSKFFGGEDWVLDDKGAGAASASQLMQSLKDRYEGEYRKHWLDFVGAATVVQYKGLPDASSKLQLHAASTSPLLQLLLLVAQNTSVESPAIANEFQPAQYVMAGATKEKLIASNNQNYAGSLQSLQGSVVTLLQLYPNGPPDAAGAAPVNQAITAALGVVRQTSQQGFRINNQTHAAVEKLMEQPIVHAQKAVEGDTGEPLNKAGQGLCTQFSAFDKKYPFTPSATDEATLDDLKFFQPGSGAFWSAYEGSFKSILIRQGNQFVISPSAQVKVNPQFIAFLTRAAIFSDAIFPPGGGHPTPHMTYALRQPVNKGISHVNLAVDGRTLSGSGGNSQNFVWPGESSQGVNRTVTLNNTGGGLPPQLYPGLWGVFKMFRNAQWTASGAEWRLELGGDPIRQPDGSPVILRYEVEGAAAQLFHTEFFKGLHCTPTVVSHVSH
jgi:type VI secretion system protein ImpL